MFVADDGEIFSTEEAALSHEAELRKKKKALASLRVRRVIHGFDATEGRGHFAKTLVITDASSAEITQWCIDKFGAPLAPWYGNGFYEAWYLTSPCDSDTVEWALKHKGYKERYGHRPWELAVVSQNDFAWAGLPKSEFPWPRPKPKKSK